MTTHTSFYTYRLVDRDPSPKQAVVNPLLWLPLQLLITSAWHTYGANNLQEHCTSLEVHLHYRAVWFDIQNAHQNGCTCKLQWPENHLRTIFSPGLVCVGEDLSPGPSFLCTWRACHSHGMIRAYVAHIQLHKWLVTACMDESGTGIASCPRVSYHTMVCNHQLILSTCLDAWMPLATNTALVWGLEWQSDDKLLRPCIWHHYHDNIMFCPQVGAARIHS